MTPLTPRSNLRSRLGPKIAIVITARCRLCGSRLTWPIHAHNIGRKGGALCSRISCQAARSDGF